MKNTINRITMYLIFLIFVVNIVLAVNETENITGKLFTSSSKGPTPAEMEEQRQQQEREQLMKELNVTSEEFERVPAETTTPTVTPASTKKLAELGTSVKNLQKQLNYLWFSTGILFLLIIVLLFYLKKSMEKQKIL